MQYHEIQPAVFIERPNRFIARVMLEEKVIEVHVKNTGRCAEILRPDTRVILECARHSGRKTPYSLIAAYKGDMLINIDSQIPNAVVEQAIQQGKIAGLENVTLLKREVTFGASRFDLYFEKEYSRGFMEVKGVTLEENGLAMFPDAPTARGTKHVHELMAAVDQGYEAILCFLLQMRGPKQFTPFDERDALFAAAVRRAAAHGVHIMAYDAHVQENGIEIGDRISVCV